MTDGLVLKECRACNKKQNVQSSVVKCYDCGSVLDIVDAPKESFAKPKKGKPSRHGNVGRTFQSVRR